MLAYGPHSTEDLARERDTLKMLGLTPQFSSACFYGHFSLRSKRAFAVSGRDWIFILGLSVER